jgi:hypothetical protein
MTTITDFIPIGVKKVAIASFILLALFGFGSHVHSAFKTGVAQRLPSTRRYIRSESPVMFWLLLSFFAAGAVFFAAALVGILWHWQDDKVF